MNTAVVGLGNIGSRLAKNLTAGGQKTIVADKTLAKAQKLASELGRNAEAMPVADAIRKADVVILAIYFDAIKQLVGAYRGALAGKIAGIILYVAPLPAPDSANKEMNPT